ncbi:MAG: hypothetical protein WA871_05055 [Candidatus Acidiferrales bacterium]
MSDPFDIFQKEGDDVLWQGSAESLEEAKKRIRALTPSPSHEYIVLCRLTGIKVVVKPHDVDEPMAAG